MAEEFAKRVKFGALPAAEESELSKRSLPNPNPTSETPGHICTGVSFLALGTRGSSHVPALPRPEVC
jgi:hypothetical protein